MADQWQSTADHAAPASSPEWQSTADHAAPAAAPQQTGGAPPDWFHSAVASVRKVLMGDGPKQVDPNSPLARGVNGAYEATLAPMAHPVDSALSGLSTLIGTDELGQVADLAKQGNYGHALLLLGKHVAEGPGPRIGASIVEPIANDVQNGNYAGAAGRAIGTAGMLAVPEMGERAVALKSGEMPAAVSPVAADLYKTSFPKSVRSATTPRQQVSSMVQAGLENKIPVTEAGLSKLGDLLGNLRQSIDARIDAATQDGVTISPERVNMSLQELRSRYAAQVNPTKDLADIDKVSKTFLSENQGPMTAERAQALKQGTYQANAGKYGKASVAQIEAEKSLAHGLRVELERYIPELADLNSKQSTFMNLENAIDSALTRKMNGASITDNFSGLKPWKLLQSIASDPSVRSRLALGVNWARQANPGKWGEATPASTLGRIDQLVAAFGNGPEKQQ